MQMGIIILLTNKKLTPTEVLDYYRGKDDVEKIFNDLKNSLQEDRIRCENEISVDGKIFILFLALILYSKIKNTSKEKELFKNLTIKQIINQLQKIKKIELANGKKIMLEITRKQKDILSAFEIKLPDFV